MKYHSEETYLLVLITQFLILPSLLRAIIISWQITLIISWSSAGLFLRINCWSARYNWLQLCCTTFRKNNKFTWTGPFNWHGLCLYSFLYYGKNATLFSLTCPSVPFLKKNPENASAKRKEILFPQSFHTTWNNTY